MYNTDKLSLSAFRAFKRTPLGKRLASYVENGLLTAEEHNRLFRLGLAREFFGGKHS